MRFEVTTRENENSLTMR